MLQTTLTTKPLDGMGTDVSVYAKPLSGYSAPEGHFPAQRLGGSQSSGILSLTLKRLRR